MEPKILSMENFLKNKEELRKSQVDLSIEEKIKIMDRLRAHLTWVEEHPIQILPKENK